MDQEARTAKRAVGERWRQANLERARHSNRRSHFLRKFGITLEELDALLISQGNRCALCQGPEPRSQIGWHLDHDHGTGKVRGILCQPCNHVIGLIESGWSMPTRDEAAEYLSQPESPSH